MERKSKEWNMGMMKVKFADLTAQYHECKQEIDEAIHGVLERSDYILGQSVSEFENNFAKYCGNKYCVGVDNGLNALTLALKCAFRGFEGDRTVLLPANTFIATALAVTNAGYKIRLCDVNEHTFLMDELSFEEVISEDVDCVMPVHLFGQQCDMDYILSRSEDYDYTVIEDACQSHGSKGYEQTIDKSFAKCFSFYPAKNLGGISDGGCIVLNSKFDYEWLMSMRNYGSVKKYYHDLQGNNSRLSTINAAVLDIKLKKLDEWNLKRNLAATGYRLMLDDIEQIKLPATLPLNKHVWHLYVIKCERRDELQEYLKEHGIETGIHYPIPIHLTKVYGSYDFGNKNFFPVTERLSKEILSLPMHQSLTEDEITYVCDTIKAFYK